MLAGAARGFLQRALAPLVARLSRVHPNTMTATGLGLAALAGLALSRTDGDPAWFLAAAALCLAYALADALDGALARAQGIASPLGDFLDHTSDRLAALLALGGLALAEHASDRLLLALMVATLWHGYLGTQIEASFGRRSYGGVGVAESLLAGLVYTLTAWWIRASGLPFTFREPLTGTVLTVTDAFAIAALPLVVMATLQRLAIARALAREAEAAPKHHA